MDFQALMQNEYAVAIGIIIASVIIAFIVKYIFKKIILKAVAKSKTDIDDKIVAVLFPPIIGVVIVIGVHIAIKTLSVLNGYASKVDTAMFLVYAVIATIFGARIVRVLVSGWFKIAKKYDKTPNIISKLINIIIYVVVLVIILDHFNVSISPLLATLGIGGLAIGLALQPTLANLFAGLHIISDKPVQPGDIIDLPEHNIKGEVLDISWRSTRIRNFPNNIVIIPNNILANSVIENTTKGSKAMSAYIDCGVDYGQDLKRVEKVALDVAKKMQKKHEISDPTYEPVLRFKEFADSNINFTVVMRAKTFGDSYLLKHEFMKALKERFDKEKIEISWPVVKMYDMTKATKKHKKK